MSLKKEINLNKKFIIIMILVNLIALGLYYSYALFETKVIKDNVVVIKTLSINITTDVSGYENNRITLLSGESKTLTINLESNYTSPNAYKLYYKLISGEANIKSTSITTVGEINETLSITCIIENRGEVDTTIEIGTKGGLIGYEIELDDDTYEFNKVVNVTFDYQDEVTESTTRKVVVGEEYGELPTPNERVGYTFMGWNGKNMLNLYNYIYDSEYLKITNKEIKIYKTNNNIWYFSSYVNSLINDKKYIVCANMDGEYTGRIYAFFGCSLYSSSKNNGKICTLCNYNNLDDKVGFKIQQNNPTNTSVNMNLVTNEVIFTNIQLEEGDTATEYEPYYVTSDVKVTQTKDHTLKAIWKENT